MLSQHAAIIWPWRWYGHVPDFCRRTYPWFLGIYLGIAPYYHVPGVPDDIIPYSHVLGVPADPIVAFKLLCFLLAAGTTSVAALSSGSFRTPGGLLGPLGFAVLAILSIPGVLQGQPYWSLTYALALVQAAAFCWLFFWIVRSGEDLRRILVPALAILYGILAIQVVSMLAASDWHWSRLCGFSADDPFGLYYNNNGTAFVIGLWLPAGALLFARRPFWSPWTVGTAFLLTVLVLAALFMTTTRTEILIVAGLAAALLLRREIRAWAAGMVLGSAIVATVAIVSFAVLKDLSCYYHLNVYQQAALLEESLGISALPRQLSESSGDLKRRPEEYVRQYRETMRMADDRKRWEAAASQVMVDDGKHWEVATSHRLYHYAVAFDSISERPLLGHGFGAARVNIGDYEIHNLWLKFAAYTGVLWPAWFALMVLFLLYQGGQLLRRDLGRTGALPVSACAAILAGALLLSLTEPGFFMAAHLNAVIWVSAGAILGLHSRLSAASAGPAEKTGPGEQG